MSQNEHINTGSVMDIVSATGHQMSACFMYIVYEGQSKKHRNNRILSTEIFLVITSLTKNDISLLHHVSILILYSGQ